VYSVADDEGPDPAPGWERLERAARATASALEGWRRRAREAEAEVARLRQELEALTTLGPLPSAEAGDELRRLRAENAVLVSRTAEARKRITSLLARLALLDARR
jgi:beta-phosphoglucomutase-like phosphatase (HAD superfamily)